MNTIPHLPQALQEWGIAWLIGSLAVTGLGLASILVIPPHRPALRSAVLIPLMLVLLVSPLLMAARPWIGWRGIPLAWQGCEVPEPSRPTPRNGLLTEESSRPIPLIEENLLEESSPPLSESSEEVPTLTLVEPTAPDIVPARISEPSTNAWGKSIISCVLLVWWAGSLAMLARLLWAAMRLRQLRRALPPPRSPRILSIWRGLLADYPAQPKLREAPPGCTPFTFGIMRPCVAVPPDMLGQSTDRQITAILAHELAHVRQRDPLLALVQGMARSLNWWNPLVHQLSAALSLSRETLCDLAAAEHVDHPRPYADALLALAEQSLRPLPSVGALGIAGSRGALADRLVTLTKHYQDMKSQLNRNYTSRAVLASLVLAGTSIAFRASFADDIPTPVHNEAPPPSDGRGELPPPPEDPPQPPVPLSTPQSSPATGIGVSDLPKPAKVKSEVSEEALARLKALAKEREAEVQELKSTIKSLKDRLAQMEKEREDDSDDDHGLDPFSGKSQKLLKRAQRLMEKDQTRGLDFKPTGPVPGKMERKPNDSTPSVPTEKSSGKERTAREDLEKQASDLARALRDDSDDAEEEVKKQSEDLERAIQRLVREAVDQATKEVARHISPNGGLLLEGKDFHLDALTPNQLHLRLEKRVDEDGRKKAPKPKSKDLREF